MMNKVVGKNMKPEQFETALKNGVIRKFDDLKSLADFYKLDYATLEKENEKFNGYMKAMKDPEFDCMFFKDAVLNTKDPSTQFVCGRVFTTPWAALKSTKRPKFSTSRATRSPVCTQQAKPPAVCTAWFVSVPSLLPTASSSAVSLPVPPTAGPAANSLP